MNGQEEALPGAPGPEKNALVIKEVHCMHCGPAANADVDGVVHAKDA